MSQVLTPPPTRTPTPPPRPRGTERTTVSIVAIKVVALGIVVGCAAALTPTLVGSERWGFLAAVWGVAAVLVATYTTGRGLPAKYLVPGTVLLVLFIVFPVVGTVQLSTTNLGDGARTTQEETAAQLVAGSVVPIEGAPRYNLTVATTGSATGGPFAFLLVDPAGGDPLAGTEDGLEPVDAVVAGGYVTEAGGYTLLTPKQVDDAGDALAALTVPTPNGEIRRLGIRQAFEGVAALTYDEQADTITDAAGTVFAGVEQGGRKFFVSDAGVRLSDQSWQSDVGLDNYTRVFTDPRISGDFVAIFGWTVLFATLSVVTTFALGLGLAVVLNDPRVRGQRIYRSILLLPYAIPGFISLLVWSGFYNRDFGLLNQLTGLDVNWLGDPLWAKVAVVLTNLWMGFPYMFLVATGALQAIPGDLKEAARIDGASGFTAFRTITFPLLLVTVAPLLVATFAFNFNNFNAIELLTEGGPFAPENPTAGGTDILISYTIRLAFGAAGQQLGFASAISVLLFILTGVIAAMQFRATRALEDRSS